MKNIDIIIKKSNKCELCQKPLCTSGCPLNNNIKDFIKQIMQDNFKGAYNILSKTTVLESICGRICPHEKQCQAACSKEINKTPVDIGKLESFIGDLAIKNNWKIRSKSQFEKNVAIIGSGPAGLTCAAFLKKNGINVTIYEKHDYLGGLLSHGIPEFRLPKDITKKTIERIINLGVEVKYNQELGKNVSIKQLEKQYDAIFIAIGANLSNRIKISGEKLKGVYGGNELLENKRKIEYKNKKIIVYGGGNVAMDVARTIKRLGAKKVTIVYRKSEEEMRADKKEINAAKEEKINFLFNKNITKIIGKNNVEAIETIETKYNKESTLLENIKGSKKKIECDYVIKAIGSHANRKVMNSLNIELNKNGKIKIDRAGKTSNNKVFAGGDVAGNIATVAWAARAGRNAAYSILEFLKK